MARAFPIILTLIATAAVLMARNDPRDRPSTQTISERGPLREVVDTPSAHTSTVVRADESEVRRAHNSGLADADTSEYREERHEMVRRQIAARGVENPAVLDALRIVPRHLFMPADQVPHAYTDRPLPIGHGQTISQPYIVAYMTELLQPASTDSVLEVGTGSGYQAAVLAEIVDEVFTVEIIPELAGTASRRLQQLGYDNVHVRNADGFFGWEEHAPFAAIVVTAAAEHLPPPLIEQLKDGGRMIIPVGSPFRTQMLMLVEKHGDDVTTRSLAPVRFVPFTRAD